MKKLIVAGMLIASYSSYAMIVNMPSSTILEQRLRQNNLACFAKKTKLHETLGNTQKSPLEVVNHIDQALYAYDKDMNNRMLSRITSTRKSEIIQCMLKGNSEAIQELQYLGLLK